MATNRFAARCAVCGDAVAPGEGTVSGDVGARRVVHVDCPEPATRPHTPIVHRTLDEHVLAVPPPRPPRTQMAGALAVALFGLLAVGGLVSLIAGGDSNEGTTRTTDVVPTTTAPTTPPTTVATEVAGAVETRPTVTAVPVANAVAPTTTVAPTTSVAPTTAPPTTASPATVPVAQAPVSTAPPAPAPTAPPATAAPTTAARPPTTGVPPTTVAPRTTAPPTTRAPVTTTTKRKGKGKGILD